MSYEKVKNFFESKGLADRLCTFDASSATVALAAAEIGCKEMEIAKSITLKANDRLILIVCSGDTKIDNTKYKAYFSTKAVMLSRDEVLPLIGHDCGGVCPFCVNDGVEVYLDASLLRFETVYPAAGSHNSVARLSLEELKALSGYKEIIDVCKPC